MPDLQTQAQRTAQSPAERQKAELLKFLHEEGNIGLLYQSRTLRSTSDLPPSAESQQAVKQLAKILGLPDKAYDLVQRRYADWLHSTQTITILIDRETGDATYAVHNSIRQHRRPVGSFLHFRVPSISENASWARCSHDLVDNDSDVSHIRIARRLGVDPNAIETQLLYEGKTLFSYTPAERSNIRVLDVVVRDKGAGVAGRFPFHRATGKLLQEILDDMITEITGGYHKAPSLVPIDPKAPSLVPIDPETGEEIWYSSEERETRRRLERGEYCGPIYSEADSSLPDFPQHKDVSLPQNAPAHLRRTMEFAKQLKLSLVSNPHTPKIFHLHTTDGDNNSVRTFTATHASLKNGKWQTAVAEEVRKMIAAKILDDYRAYGIKEYLDTGKLPDKPEHFRTDINQLFGLPKDAPTKLQILRPQEGPLAGSAIVMIANSHEVPVGSIHFKTDDRGNYYAAETAFSGSNAAEFERRQ